MWPAGINSFIMGLGEISPCPIRMDNPKNKQVIIVILLMG
jgi:hypothetical protein